MKNSLLSKHAKICIDILLVTGFISLILAGHVEATTNAYLTSLHCITGCIWLLLIALHTAQHWPFIKALTKKKVFLRNKITALTTISFILMAASILLFVIGFNRPSLRFHNVTGHLFLIIIIIHTIDKFKRFRNLF